MTRTQIAAKKLKEKIIKEFTKNKCIETKVAVLDTIKDYDDIIDLCNMIIDGDRAAVIERKYSHLDTVVRDVFPLSIFGGWGELVGSTNTPFKFKLPKCK